MTDSIELFRKDKELHDWWNAIVKNDDFAKVKTFAQSAMIESADVTAEHIKGAKMFAEKLDALGDHSEDEQRFPGPGLSHNLDGLPRRELPERPKTPPASTKSNRRKK